MDSMIILKLILIATIYLDNKLMIHKYLLSSLNKQSDQKLCGKFSKKLW